jgi:hypothetical protein
MPGRVLNFSEFYGKYSSETADEKNLDSFTQSSANFEEGFDDATYDQNPLGPNRPVSSGMEATPAQPGETGAPAFSSQVDASMNAPEEQEIPEETEEEEFEEIESDEDTEESPENEESDVPEPEAGSNPKKEKEKMEESRKFRGLKGFSQFINESYEEYEDMYDDSFGEEEYDEFEGEYGMNPEEDTMDDEFCPNCGTEIGYSPEGASCGCNM